MSTKRSDVSYMDNIMEVFPDRSHADFYSLVVCGDTDSRSPDKGFCGYAAIPVYSTFDQPIYSFFGDFKESIMTYERVPEYMVDRNKTPYTAVRSLLDIVGATTAHPVFISAQAGNWAYPIFKQLAADTDLVLDNVEFLDLRAIFSAYSNEVDITIGCEKATSVYQLFKDVPPLPRRFGLFAIAENLGISTICTMVPGPMQRCLLTKLVAQKCL